MKEFKNNLLLIFATVLFVACDIASDSDDLNIDDNAPENFILSGEITSRVTLSSDKVWTISGRVFVVDGGELVIPAGTILKAKPGTETNASFLCIARGGKIDAQEQKNLL